MAKKRRGDTGYTDGVPCEHPGCGQHFSHPCEVCGRIACKNPKPIHTAVTEATQIFQEAFPDRVEEDIADILDTAADQIYCNAEKKEHP